MSTRAMAEQWRLADDEVRSKLPAGVTLVRTLRGHAGWIGHIAWSQDGQLLATPSAGGTTRLWDAKTWRCLRTFDFNDNRSYSVAFDPTGKTFVTAHLNGDLNEWDAGTGALRRTIATDQRRLYCVAYDPTGRMLCSGGSTATVKLWDAASGQLICAQDRHLGPINGLAFDAQGKVLASGSDDNAIMLWDTETGRQIVELRGHRLGLTCVSFNPRRNLLASSAWDGTVKLWDVSARRLLRTLEGHVAHVNSVAFSADGTLLASKADGRDNTVRVWNVDTGNCLLSISEPASTSWYPSLAFHPHLPILATVGSDPRARREELDSVVHIWELDLAVVHRAVPAPSTHYLNAKVVVVGDTGVGKSGLSLVLNNQPYKETDSTAGRHVWAFDACEVPVENNGKHYRETFLWDLAGQPGYRVIQQLYLNEVAVALVVFDARSETDPLAGVQHWDRALRLARQRQGDSGIPMKKFLVSARNDRGGPSIGERRLQAVLKEFGFDQYFKTSAKEGWGIAELRIAIERAIDWRTLPEVSSSLFFTDIKAFLFNVKKSGQLLAPVCQLCSEFARQVPEREARGLNLRDHFNACVGLLENRDLVRRLTFGDYVLLQPELLDAYASAMVNAAKDEPDGLGSLAEDVALAGKFFVPGEQRIAHAGQEQLLLHATVEELVRNDLALRENANDGRYLVFPSQFNRDYEDAPEPRGKAVVITFDGPVQSVYATLVVRLGHSGLFTTKRVEMWRNAAVFTARTGGKCGLFVQEFAEARGRFVLFFADRVGAETRYHFEEFVLDHTKRRALVDSVELVRVFVCGRCGEPVPDAYVRMLRAQGKPLFNCPCGASVPLTTSAEKAGFPSEVEAMGESADRQRNLDAFIVSAKGETTTRSFRDWAGGERMTLAVVFTDVVGSTALGEGLRDEAMNDVRMAHFAQSRRLIAQCEGREIKTVGDSFMVAFKRADCALDYAIALGAEPGHACVRIRAGIHIGPMQVEESDVYGGTVNFAARVVDAFEGAGVWLSETAKSDIDQLGAARHKELRWERHADVAMKGFPAASTLWSLRTVCSGEQDEKRPGRTAAVSPGVTLPSTATDVAAPESGDATPKELASVPQALGAKLAASGKRFDISADFSRVVDKQSKTTYDVTFVNAQLALQVFVESALGAANRRTVDVILAAVNKKREQIGAVALAAQPMSHLFRNPLDRSKKRMPYGFYGSLIRSEKRMGLFWMEL